MGEANGVLAGGHFIVDQIKIIDHYPAQDELAVVRSQTRSGGGGPFNLLCGLAAMGAEFPLHAVALIGDDDNGHWLADACRQRGVQTGQMQTTSETATAWTDVMAVEETGRRTFFHFAGANMLLAEPHFNFDQANERIFYLGYLSLLERLDAFGPDGRTQASHVFERARKAGLITAADLVSRKHSQLRQIVASAAPHLDYLLLNELEAAWIVGRTLSGTGLSRQSLEQAATEILSLGISTAVVVHCEHGAVCVHRDGTFAKGALNLPADFIKTTLGAGDAFAAGFLYGVHQGMDMDECLHNAVCVAAACLSDASASDGIRSVSECLALAEKYGLRSLP